MKISHLLMFLGGAAIGAVIALLLAPESGTENREKINAKLKEHGIDLSKEQLDEFIEMIKQKLDIKIKQESETENNTVINEEA